MRVGTASLLLASVGSALGAAYDAEALGGADLACSACTLLVEEFHSRCASTVFKTGKATPASTQKLYKQWVQQILKEKNVSPNTQKRLLAELANANGKEYAIYARLCKRHGITPEPEQTDEEDDGDTEGEVERKQGLAEVPAAFESTSPPTAMLACFCADAVHAARPGQEALEKVVSSVKESGSQWALVGLEGSRKYIDFNKAMTSGQSMNNLQMSPQVSDSLQGAFSALAEEHGHVLTTSIAEAARLYDARLHTTFCTDTVPVCKRKGKDRDEL